MFLMPDSKWARPLAYVTELVNQKLLLQNEYLAAENRILRAHLPSVGASPIPRDRLQLKSVSDSAGRRLTRQARQVDKCLVAPESAHDFSTSDDLAWPFEQEARAFETAAPAPDADTCPALFLVPQVGFKFPKRTIFRAPKCG
jgi:hypothetical protein